MRINFENILKERGKASTLQIVIMIISIFAFSFILASYGEIEEVSAAGGSTLEYSVCCEKTNYGAWCQNQESESDCDSNYNSVPTSCDSTSYCRLGCCYDSDEGICMERTPERVCSEAEGTWFDDEECEIPQCELGCCLIAGQAAFVSLVRCNKLSGFYGVNSEFKSNVENELDCIALAQAQDRGACVYESDFIKTCKMTTRNDCKTTSGNSSFHKDFLCTAPELGTNCAKTKETTCVEGKDGVYFMDSCGNPANIYDASRVDDSSYWRKIISEAESCGASKSNAGSKSCGNCDYFLGSFCRPYESSKDQGRPSYGNNICRDLNCENAQHGESWCEYDGLKATGEIDSVGARQFRHICIVGEELVEPCADFRQEVCIEDSIETSEGDFSVAGCRVNRWQDCVVQTEKDDCENTDKRDCEWIEGKGIILLNNTDAVCIPKVAPGLAFWEEGDASSTCAVANTQCTVVFEKSLTGGKKCVQNCECLTQQWEDDMNKVCQSLGDCGSDVNFINRETADEDGNIKVWTSSAVILALVKAAASVLPLGLGRGQIPFDEIWGKDVIIHPDRTYEIITPKIGSTPTPTGLSPFKAIDPTKQYHIIGIEVGQAVAHITQGLMWAGMAIMAIKLVGGLLGLDEGLTGALSNAAAAGIMAGKLAYVSGLGGKYVAAQAGQKLSFLASKGLFGLTMGGTIFTFAIAAAVFVLTYKEVEVEIVHFECYPWEAPTGGADCKKCGTGEACSEYKCKSLGQACELLNAGTGSERCEWVNPNDVKPPVISTWEEVLTKDHSYRSDTAIHPPDRGVKIIGTGEDGCIEPFTALEFGIQTFEDTAKTKPEAAQCKIDYSFEVNKTDAKKFDNLKYYFGDTNLYLYNHTQQMRLPSPTMIKDAVGDEELPGNLELLTDGKYELFVSCRDKNGNENEALFVVTFCVEDAPDNTPPVVEDTSIVNNAPVQYQVDEVDVDFYINEPASCKWSRSDESYDNMDDVMQCSEEIWEMNAQMLYPCSATLSGIEDRKTNTFYVRCKDKAGNANTISYIYTLKGTQDLNITSISPEKDEVIKGSTSVVPVDLEVETINGYNEGESACYFSDTGNENDYVLFQDTNSYEHKQRLNLPAGEYTYYVKCIDLGGNQASTKTEFEVEVDKNAPRVVRFYYDSAEGGVLKLVTDEDATCVYSNSLSAACTYAFEEGNMFSYMREEKKTEHYTEWNDLTYYIKCRDDGGNYPTNECSVIIRPGFLEE